MLPSPPLAHIANDRHMDLQKHASTSVLSNTHAHVDTQTPTLRHARSLSHNQRGPGLALDEERSWRTYNCKTSCVLSLNISICIYLCETNTDTDTHHVNSRKDGLGWHTQNSARAHKHTHIHTHTHTHTHGLARIDTIGHRTETRKLQSETRETIRDKRDLAVGSARGLT